MKKWISLLAALAIVSPLHAESVTAPAAKTTAMSEGVVRKIDTAGSKITLKHGPIANLDMPPMTMVFRVQAPALLSGIKVGDPVTFRAERFDGVFTVTAIQVVR